MNEKNKRIEWIDIFKGLAIILVVIGHSTGQFNGYIYQFHVAAFFFISGWVAIFDNTKLFNDLYKKIMINLHLSRKFIIILYNNIDFNNNI